MDAAQVALTRRIKRLGMHLGALKSTAVVQHRRLYASPSGYFVGQLFLTGWHPVHPATAPRLGYIDTWALRGMDEGEILDNFRPVAPWERAWIAQHREHIKRISAQVRYGAWIEIGRQELRRHASAFDSWSDGSDTFYFDPPLLRKALMALTGKQVRMAWHQRWVLLVDEHDVHALVFLRAPRSSIRHLFVEEREQLSA